MSETIVEYLQVACYAELAEYWGRFQNINEFNDLLNLLDSDQIRRIVRNSIKNQSNLISSYYQYLATQTQSNQSSSSILNTAHITTRKEAEEILSSNFTWLEGRLLRIDTKITRFRASLRNWIQTSSNESYEAALVGGFIGSLLLGPVGAFAGAWIGASGSGSASSEFEREFENLLIDYNNLLNEVKESLDMSFNMSGELFSQVAIRFSTNNSSNSSRLPNRKTLIDRLLPWKKNS